MVRWVTVYSVVCFLEIKRYQTFIVVKGATYVVFVYRSLLHWCFYVLVLYSMPIPVWLFATRASIVCIDSGTRDTICISLALAIWFLDISINRYTANVVVYHCKYHIYVFVKIICHPKHYIFQYKHHQWHCICKQYLCMSLWKSCVTAINSSRTAVHVCAYLTIV